MVDDEWLIEEVRGLLMESLYFCPGVVGDFDFGYYDSR